MLIKIFDKWINPNNIIRIEAGYWSSSASGFEAGDSGSTLYFKNSEPVVFKSSTPDEVAAEINSQWPVKRIQAEVTNHF